MNRIAGILLATSIELTAIRGDVAQGKPPVVKPGLVAYDSGRDVDCSTVS